MATLTSSSGAMLPSSGAPVYQPPGGTIQLSVLIDFIVQRTYHELQVLSELLPRKTDMERKIEIVQFCSRTRQLFIRLLSLVKWANNCGKVDKCAQITGFLDQQSMLFIHTADRLAQISRDSLPQARLSVFSIPHAVDVLTTGTYPRLPSCIKERILPADPITIAEKESTLKRLSLIIQHRLASNEFPPQLSIVSITRGKVLFRVDDEFEASLTVMGDTASFPWRLLDVEILVDDLETADGKALVHSLQVQYLHQLIQARLYEAAQPLHDLYNVLHAFCLSLQLEVLFSQTQKLQQERLGDVINVESYVVGTSLQLNYWRDKAKLIEGTAAYSLIIQVNLVDPKKPLLVTHKPPLIPAGKSLQKRLQISTNIQSEKLSVEKLLVHTCQARSLIALESLLPAFELNDEDVRGFGEGGKCQLAGTPPVLALSLLEPCAPSEMLRIAVSSRTGDFRLSIPIFETCDILKEMEAILNGPVKNRGQVKVLLWRLRVKLTMHRCRISIQHLPVLILESLPLVGIESSPISKLSGSTIYMKLLKHPGFYLIYELKQALNAIESKFYMLKAKPCRYVDGDSTSEMDSGGAQLYLQPSHFMELDKFMLLRGPTTALDENSLTDETEEDVMPVNVSVLPLLSKHRKRKADTSVEKSRLASSSRHPSAVFGLKDNKMPRSSITSPYLIPELPYVVSVCDDRIPFIALQEELNKHGIRHQGVQIEGPGLCLQLTITAFPALDGTEPGAAEELNKKMLQCTLRMQGKVSNPRVWVAEFLFRDPPIDSSYVWEQQPVRRVLLVFEQFQSLVSELLLHWVSLVQLHWTVSQMGAVLDPKLKTSLHGQVEVKCFNYKKVTLGYGSDLSYHVNVGFSANQRQFVVTFGSRGGAGFNGHVLLTQFYLALFNSTKSLPLLARTLVISSGPLQALVKLSQMPSLGVGEQAYHPCPGCSIIPQSPTHFRLAANSIYVLDIVCQENGLVAIRDGAFSRFDCSTVVEGFMPIQGLKSFLMQYVDEKAVEAQRHASAADDDNPPSPVGVDSLDTLLSSQGLSMNPRTPGAAPSPAGGPMGRGSSFPMTPSPANPASPAGGAVNRGANQSHASPGAAFPSLTSPSAPSHHITPSPMMGTPSPGNVLTAASPGNMHVPSPSFGHAPSPGCVGIMPSPSFISPNSPARGGGPCGIPASPRQMGLAHSPAVSAGNSGQLSNTQMQSLPLARQLPQRAWAASVPTLLSHEALHTLCTPCTLTATPNGFPLSPLERFFGCSTLRKHLQRIIAKEEGFQAIAGSDNRAVIFQTPPMMNRVPQSLEPGLAARVFFNPSNMLTLHLKVQPMAHAKDAYTPDDLLTLEKYFDTRVAIPPYRINGMSSFLEFFKAPVRIMKDVIRILSLDLNSSLPSGSPPLKWTLNVCLTLPPQAPQIFPPGFCSVYIKPAMDKILLMLQLNRLPPAPAPGTPAPEPSLSSVCVPIYHEISSNQTSYLGNPPNQPPPVSVAVASHLQRFNEQFRTNPSHMGSNECSLFPSVKDMLLNLNLN